MATTLRYFWFTRGHHREGCEWVTAVLVHAGPTLDSLDRAKGLAALGFLLTVRGQFAAARPHLQVALDISRAPEDTAGTAFALRYLGLGAVAESDSRGAQAYLEESLGVYRQLGLAGDIALAETLAGSSTL